MFEKLINQVTAIFNNELIAIMIVKNMHIIWANALMHNILGYEPEELHGQPTSILSALQENHTLFNQEAYSSIVEGQNYSGTIPQKRKDGSIGWFYFNVSGLIGFPDVAVTTLVGKTTTRPTPELTANSISQTGNGASFPPANAEEGKNCVNLTKQQQQILEMITRGMTSEEIGKQLDLTTPTVISYRRTLMLKLDLHSNKFCDCP